MINKIALSLMVLFSVPAVSFNQNELQKQLTNAIYRLDVDAVSRMANAGDLKHVNMVEIFKELTTVEEQLQKTLNIKAAVKGFFGLVCMAVSGRYIYNAYTLNEDSQGSVADLFWRLMCGQPGNALATGASGNVYNLPLTAFSGVLFTLGSQYALNGYGALYKNPLNNGMQQKLRAIVHILINANPPINEQLVG